MSSESGIDLSAVLAELFYGHDTVENTTATLLAPEFVQRIGGRVYDVEQYREHLSEMRRIVVGEGEVQVLEEIRQADSIAGRYLFITDTADGRVEFECAVFARVDHDDRLLRLAEINRQLTPDDDANLLRTRTDV